MAAGTRSPQSAATRPAGPPPYRGAVWGAVSRPAPGPPRVIGAYALGCIAGAVALPLEGPGWQVVRASRNRFWGHPSLIAFIRDFAGRARARGFADLWIGDLGQPRGGPMAFGHASHQSGLDVDVWLDLAPKPAVPAAAREDIRVASLVLPDETGIDPARWTPRHAALIRLAAESPGVERVLVNHAIKRALCRTDAPRSSMFPARPAAGRPPRPPAHPPPRPPRRRAAPPAAPRARRR